MAKSNLSVLVSVLMSVVALVVSVGRRVLGFVMDPTGKKRLDAALEVRRRVEKTRLAGNHGEIRRRMERHLKDGKLSFVRQDLPHLERLRCEYNSRCRDGETLIPCEKQEIERAIEERQAELDAAERTKREADEKAKAERQTTAARALAVAAQLEQEAMKAEAELTRAAEIERIKADFESAVGTGLNLCEMREVEAAKTQVERARNLRRLGNKAQNGLCDFQRIKTLDAAIDALGKTLEREAKAAAQANQPAATNVTAQVTAPAANTSSPKGDTKAAKREAKRREKALIVARDQRKLCFAAHTQGLKLCAGGLLKEAEAQLINARTAFNAANAAYKVGTNSEIQMICDEELLPLIEEIDSLRPKVIVTLAELKEQELRSRVKTDAAHVSTCIMQGHEAVRTRKYARAQLMFDNAIRTMKENPFVERSGQVNMKSLEKLARHLGYRSVVIAA